MLTRKGYQWRVRRTIVSLVLFLMIPLLLTGISGAQQFGGTLIQGLDSDPRMLLPAATSGVVDNVVACRIYEGLVRIDREWRPQPLLAESWKVSDDATTYTFHLREGVRWHDGMPFTSTDVKFTLEEIAFQYHPRTSLLGNMVETIETPDDHTVIIQLKEPYGPIFGLLSCESAAMAPKHVFEGTDILSNPAALSNPIGTGPFTLTQWNSGQFIILDRNDDYWNQPKPYLDRIIVRIIPDSPARVTAMEAGEIDFLADYVLPKDQYQRLVRTPGIKGMDRTYTPIDDHLILNVRREPLNNRLVRQALLTAIDRQFIVDRVYFGIGEPGTSAITPTYAWAYNPDVNLNERYAYDPERAEQMLDEAGYPRGADGIRFTMRVMYDAARPQHRATMEVVREHLRDIGVELILEGAERQVVLEKVFVNWDFDSMYLSYGTTGDPAAGIQRIYMTDSIVKQPFTNATGYSNPEVDELFDLGATAPSIDERGHYYRQVQEILAEDLPTLLLVHTGSVDVAQEYVRGLWKGATPFHYWEEVWIEQ